LTRRYPEAHAQPDYLSSSRKRLAPQLLFKGGIINSWGKKMAVALDHNFYSTLPALPEVPRAEAEMAWLIYMLRLDETGQRYMLELHKTVYTKFLPSLQKITVAKPGSVSVFISHLQSKLDEKLVNPPDTGTIQQDVFG
jgi:hypothetical protein